MLLLDIPQVTTPVGAEYRGLARSFINKARGAHKAHNEFIDGITAEIVHRHNRHPERTLPADMLADISRRWRAAADGFRLTFVSSLKNNKGTICEARLGYQGLIHASWDETEPNVVVAFVSLSVTKRLAQITVRVEHSFSAHSIARFYQRSGCRKDREVIEAMISALVIEPKQHKVGDEIDAGSWRGIIKSRDVGDDQILIWCARTWI